MAKDQTNANAVHQPAAGAPAARAEPTRPTNERPAAAYYRPKPDLHLTKAGKVALGNWCGKVDGQTHWVYYGAQLGDVPERVRAAMRASRVGFGIITMDDFKPHAPDRTLPRPAPQPEA